MKAAEHYKSLNKEQTQAVFQDGNIMCIAGAGSGKTKSLTTRIIRLIEDGTSPEAILGLTFTNQAAKEMQERLASMHPKGSQVKMTTFHSFAAKFLRPNAEWINRTNDYTIYDDSDQKNLIKRIMKDGVYATLNGSSEQTPHKILNMISNIKCKITDIEINIDVLSETHSPADCHIIQEYERFLQDYNAMDFNDLIRYSVAIMQVDDTTVPIYDHVLLDEFQDTDPVQFAMVKIFSKYAKLSAFADGDQLIYEWRNALTKHIMEYIDIFNATLIKLEDNYRSTPCIVKAANQVIEVNQNRIKKVMRVTRDEKYPVVVNHVLDSDHEAAATSDTIKHIQESYLNATVGILYRQNRYSRKMETSLRRMNIEYYLHKGVAFTKRREIALTIRLFRFLCNPKDIEAATAVFNHFMKGFGPAAMRNVAEAFAAANSDDILIGNVNLNVRPALQVLFEELMTILASIPNISLNELSQYIYDHDIAVQLCKFNNDEDRQYEDRQANLNELMLWINEYAEENQQATLSDFIQESSLDISTINDPKDAKVHLMTVHASKGLEFDYIFIIGCVKGFFPGKCDNEASVEEARRLFYVAMTRAKEVLYLCVPKYTYLDPPENTPAPYISSIDKTLLKIINPKPVFTAPQNKLVANF